MSACTARSRKTAIIPIRLNGSKLHLNVMLLGVLGHCVRHFQYLNTMHYPFVMISRCWKTLNNLRRFVESLGIGPTWQTMALIRDTCLDVEYMN